MPANLNPNGEYARYMASGVENAAYIHDGGDFVTVTDTDGVVSSIRWSAVEHFRYDAKNRPD